MSEGRIWQSLGDLYITAGDVQNPRDWDKLLCKVGPYKHCKWSYGPPINGLISVLKGFFLIPFIMGYGAHLVPIYWCRTSSIQISTPSWLLGTVISEELEPQAALIVELWTDQYTSITPYCFQVMIVYLPTFFLCIHISRDYVNQHITAYDFHGSWLHINSKNWSAYSCIGNSTI